MRNPPKKLCKYCKRTLEKMLEKKPRTINKVVEVR
jgi:hypothetical protein